MKFGTEVSLDPSHIVLDGDPDPAHRKKGGHSRRFSARVRCGQTAGWITMPPGTVVGLGPGDIVLDGNPAPPPKKKGRGHPPNFRPMSVVAKRSSILTTAEHLLYCPRRVEG